MYLRRVKESTCTLVNLWLEHNCERTWPNDRRLCDVIWWEVWRWAHDGSHWSVNVERSCVSERQCRRCYTSFSVLHGFYVAHSWRQYTFCPNNRFTIHDISFWHSLANFKYCWFLIALHKHCTLHRNDFDCFAVLLSAMGTVITNAQPTYVNSDATRQTAAEAEQTQLV